MGDQGTIGSKHALKRLDAEMLSRADHSKIASKVIADTGPKMPGHGDGFHKVGTKSNTVMHGATVGTAGAKMPVPGTTTVAAPTALAAGSDEVALKDGGSLFRLLAEAPVERTAPAIHSSDGIGVAYASRTESEWASYFSQQPTQGALWVDGVGAVPVGLNAAGNTFLSIPQLLPRSVKRRIAQALLSKIDPDLAVYPEGNAQCIEETARIKARVAKALPGFSEGAKGILRELAKMGVSDIDVWHGSHIVVDGAGIEPDLYDVWSKSPGRIERESSHYPNVDCQQYEVELPGLGAVLFGRDENGNTWLQLENHSGGKDLVNSLGHVLDFVLHKASGDFNVGPLGITPRTDKRGSAVHVTRAPADTSKRVDELQSRVAALKSRVGGFFSRIAGRFRSLFN